MTLAAEALLGRRVSIRWRAPITKEHGGEAFADLGGIAAINIKPGLTAVQTYRTWLHEVAHHHLGHVDYSEPRKAEDFPAELRGLFEGGAAFLQMSPIQLQEYWTSPEEAAARSVAGSLDQYVEGKALERFGDRSIEARLRCFADTTLRSEE